MDAPACGSCKFFATVKNMTKSGSCVRYPPKVFPFMQQTPIGGQQMTAQGFFPPIDADRWCGEWKGKITVGQATGA